jgi:predicted glycosyltransferase
MISSRAARREPRLEPGATQTDAASSAAWLVGQPRPKILLYSHDTFGLGNIRRSLLLGELFASAYPRAAILLVTGSPMIHAFKLPKQLDYVKLPCVNRVTAEQYEPRFLTDCVEEVRRTRSAILEQSVVAFRPDLMVVDKRAAGIDGELLPALKALRRLSRPPRLVLGIRDILDAPSTTKRTLRENGSFDVMAKYYDEIWIYGSPNVFDAVIEYEFPRGVACKTRYCGYLRRAAVPKTSHVGPVPRVLVTAGGGEDGRELIGAYLADVLSGPHHALHSTVVFGPQLEAGAAEALRASARGRADVQFVDFEPEMARRYEAADVVVSMAGYNTVCELLTAGVRGVLVPRAEPVQEQLIRARRLAARGCFRVVEPGALTTGALVEAVREALAAAAPTGRAVDMEGLTRIRERAHRLLQERAE